jgi:lipopolysaccharide export system protein LptA
MNWRRTVRIAVAVIGIGTAVAVVVLRRKPAVTTAPPAVPAAVDKSASREGGAGRNDIFDSKTGKKRGEIEFAASRHYDDGRNVFDKIHIKRLDESAYDLWADTLETKGKGTEVGVPAESILTGHVRLETKDGLRLETERATYFDALGVVDMPGEIKFTKRRLSGRGVGGRYVREGETVDFFDQATAEVAPDAGGKGGARASSKRMTMLRGKKSLLLDEKATIVSETDTLAGDVATLYFTDDEQSIRYLELRGNASVTPVAGGGAGSHDMRADSITLTFHPDGRTLQHATLTTQASLGLDQGAARKTITASWIDLYTGPDGRTVTRLDARDRVVVTLPAGKDSPARTIRSPTLSATGTEKDGLTSARFETGVTFEEMTPGRAGAKDIRKATSETLTLALAGGLDAIEKADFRQNVEFTDRDLRARADAAEYREKEGALLLRQAEKGAKRIPNVTDVKVQVDALAIDLNTRTHDLSARGDVRTVTKPDPDRDSKRPSALFNDKEPVKGLSDTFTYVNASGKATYRGTATAQARVFQGKSDVIADEIQLDDSTQNLDAKGRVATTFEMTVQADGQKTPAKPTEYHATALAFRYDDTKRVANYDGTAASLVTLKSTDGETEGERMTLRLAEQGRALTHLHVEGAVYSKIPGGYEAIGNVLDYNVASDTYRLSGQAAKVKSPPQTGSTKCGVTTGLTIDLNKKEGSVRVPASGGAPAGTTEIPCTQSLRPATR